MRNRRPHVPSYLPTVARMFAVSESPGRYQRSFAGMVGAMLVTVGLIVAFVVFRAVNRDELDVEPQPIDHVPSVEAAQEAGYRVAYPSQLPQGWRVTSLTLTTGEDAVWGLGMLTDDDTFVGIRQQDAPLPDLLTTYVDEESREGPVVPAEGEIARVVPEWQRYDDAHGDQAYAGELGDEVLLVYGSDATALGELVGLLTVSPVQR